MSKREDIIDGSLAETAKYGLVYTEHCGWVDLGHANPKGALSFWADIKKTQVVASPLSRPIAQTYGGRPVADVRSGGAIAYSQMMGNRYFKVGVMKRYKIKTGLTEAELQGVALSIFQEVSLAFEDFQSSPIFAWKSDSGFSGEDLVSDLVSFYRAVLPGARYVELCKPVAKDEALKIWDTFGPVGSLKNKTFDPILFPMDQKTNKRTQKTGKLPLTLRQISPAVKGVLHDEVRW